jgi:hypothetical protein
MTPECAQWYLDQVRQRLDDLAARHKVLERTIADRRDERAAMVANIDYEFRLNLFRELRNVVEEIEATGHDVGVIAAAAVEAGRMRKEIADALVRIAGGTPATQWIEENLDYPMLERDHEGATEQAE